MQCKYEHHTAHCMIQSLVVNAICIDIQQEHAFNTAQRRYLQTLRRRLRSDYVYAILQLPRSHRYLRLSVVSRGTVALA